MTIKSFTIQYDAINAPNIFSNGDSMTGRIIMETSSQMKIKSITFKARGKTTVQWSEHYGQYTTVVYHATEKYYKVAYTILGNEGTEILMPGKHVFPFTFKIPDRDMASTFKAKKGKVVHSLEAKLNRSLKIAKKAQTKFTFISKADLTVPGLLQPQYGSKEKDVFFASGYIALNVYTEKTGYLQGEALKIIVEVNNSSSRSVKPKFYLYEKQSVYAQGQRRVDTKNILKGKSEPVLPLTRQTVDKELTIPLGLPATILNCSILKLEYRLKVILDVTLTKNPEVKLPIIVLPNLDFTHSKELQVYS